MTQKLSTIAPTAVRRWMVMVMVDKCKSCTEKCPQAEMAHQAALGRMYTTREFITLLKKVESGELVEVVRCKDCEKWERTEPYRNYGYCHHPGFHLRIPYVMNDKFFHPLTKTTDFCSYGERKTDERKAD